jgi:hypothetical protein
MDRTNTDDSVNDDTLSPDKGGEPQKVENGHDGDADTPEDIARARRMGWRPPEEFDDSMVAKPRKMLSATDYIAKVESDLPILRERNRFLDQSVGKLEKKLSDTEGALKSNGERLTELGTLVEDLHKQNVEVGKRAYGKAKRELQEQIDAAVRDANPEVVRQLTSEMVDLEKSKPADAPAKREVKPETQTKPADPEKRQLSEAAQSWIDSNARIMSDAVLNPLAVEIHAENIKSGLTEDQSFSKLADQVRAEMPQKFENKRRNAPAAVASTSAPASTREKKKTFDNLPPESKQAYESLRKIFEVKGRKYTKEDYANDYFVEMESRQ